MNETEYTNIAGIRSSWIKALAVGGPRALWQAVNGEIAETASMKFGRLVHDLVAGSGNWACAQFDGRTKEGKAERAEFAAKGVEVVTADEMARATKCAEVLKGAVDLAGASLEACFTSTDGPGLKARLDALLADGETVVDWKTTSDITRAERDFWARRYDLQAGLAAAILRDNGRACTCCKFVFVETSAPFRRVTVVIDGALLDMAVDEARVWARQADELVKTYGADLDAWPQAQDIRLEAKPSWIE